MKRQFVLRSIAGAALAGVLAACGTAEQAPRQAPPAPVASVEQAEQRLAEVAAERAAVQARFAEREAVCYEKFFVNNCLDEAKERRRAALAAQRAIEIDAERFIRQAKVDERDRAIAEAEARLAAEEARLAAEPPKPPRQASEAPPPKPAPVKSRIARHNERMKEAAAREQDEAAKRAANVKAFEERKRESEERQRAVAQRKAEREARAAREAREAKEEAEKAEAAAKAAAGKR